MNMYMSDLAAICVTFRVLLVSVCCMFVVHCAFVQSLGSGQMKKKVCNFPTVLKEKRAKRIDKIVRWYCQRVYSVSSLDSGGGEIGVYFMLYNPWSDSVGLKLTDP